MQDVSQPFPIVVGDVAAESWQYLMWGIWESGLRIDELMHVSWDDANQIRPVWQRGRLPVLAIPHERQKNVTEESIPLLPGFESLLLQTPEQGRVGVQSQVATDAVWSQATTSEAAIRMGGQGCVQNR